MFAEKLFELFRGGLQGIFFVSRAFGPAKMGSQDQARALFDGQPQSGKRFADTGVVGDYAVFQGDVEVHAEKDAFAAQV